VNGGGIRGIRRRSKTVGARTEYRGEKKLAIILEYISRLVARKTSPKREGKTRRGKSQTWAAKEEAQIVSKEWKEKTPHIGTESVAEQRVIELTTLAKLPWGGEGELWGQFQSLVLGETVKNDGF